VADYCNPLIPQSFSPINDLNNFAAGTAGYFADSNGGANSYQLPLLTEAQHALDWCMNNDQCVASNCNQVAANCNSNVSKAAQTNSLGFNFLSTYTKKYATHGVLACTSLPRAVAPVEQCTNQVNYQKGNVCARAGGNGFHAPAIITPDNPTASNVWQGSEPTTLQLVVISGTSNNVTLQNPAFFRILPMRTSNVFSLTVQAVSYPVKVWITGCGYSDDCDSWTALPIHSSQYFPLSSVLSSSAPPIPFTFQHDCGLFLAVEAASNVTSTASW